MAEAERRSIGSWRHESFVSLPSRTRSPWVELGYRALLAFGLLFLTTMVVYLDRGGYRDANDDGNGISFIDALYYATVTITTTGYGDITPVTQFARIMSAIIITPVRIMFLALLVGTTLEVLANEGRRALRHAQWRQRMHDHTIVVGYGSKGRAAVNTLLAHGTPAEKIVVIEKDEHRVAEANRRGLAAMTGDAVSRDLLNRAELGRAREVIVTMDRDDSTILVVLTTRQLNPSAHIVAAVAHDHNVDLVRQSGASVIVTSSDAVGRLLGLSTVSPTMGVVMEDLLSSGEGIEVAQRGVAADEVGTSARDLGPDERCLAVVRDGTVRRFYDEQVQHLAPGDQLVVVRRSDRDDTVPPPGSGR